MKISGLGVALILALAPSVGLCEPITGKGSDVDNNESIAIETASQRAKNNAYDKCEEHCKTRNGVKKYEASAPTVKSSKLDSGKTKAEATCDATCECFSQSSSGNESYVADPIL